MFVSEMIEKLQDILAKQGDTEVLVLAFPFPSWPDGAWSPLQIKVGSDSEERFVFIKAAE